MVVVCRIRHRSLVGITWMPDRYSFHPCYTSTSSVTRKISVRNCFAGDERRGELPALYVGLGNRLNDRLLTVHRGHPAIESVVQLQSNDSTPTITPDGAERGNCSRYRNSEHFTTDWQLQY